MDASASGGGPKFTGERLVAGLQGDIAYEHLHRYAIACELARGKTVLDVACGDGYGSYLLAAVAERVIGVDIASDVIDHARRVYQRENLSFEIADASATGLPDASVDVVVSFETLEHISQPEAFLAEIRRVLRPDGMAIVSTPELHAYNKHRAAPNAYHVKEFDRQEFLELVTRRFPFVALYGQRVCHGSLIAPLEPARLDATPDWCFHTFTGDYYQLEGASGIVDAPYLVAVATADPDFKFPGGSLFETEQLATDLGQHLQAAARQIEAMRQSLSWKVTAPLRCVGAAVLRAQNAWSRVFRSRPRRVLESVRQAAADRPVELLSIEPPKAIFPLHYENALRKHRPPLLVPGECNACGATDGFVLTTFNFREDLRCPRCQSINRKRQIVAVLLEELGAGWKSILRDAARRNADGKLDHPGATLPESIWIMETGLFAAQFLTTHLHMTEYLSPKFASGALYRGVRHEDAMAPSFADGSLDLVISSDVFEHVADAYRAHAEVFRCLKPGGFHVCTVPFLEGAARDEVYATLEDGEIRHHQEKVFHGDPLRPEGSLVFRIFGREMHSRLQEIGFETKQYRVHSARFGVLGDNGIVFVARKPHGEASR